MRVAGIGDNCIDIYEKLGKKYPTGNVVDTIVNLQKLGIAASIISTIGNDSHGEWMQKTLQSERVDISHLKVKEGKTAITYMDIEENERIHGNYVEGVVEHILFDKEDIAFAVSHNLVHTALWGRAEGTLPAIAAAGVPISFDYGDRLEHSLVEQTLPYVTYGFYSCHGRSREETEAFLKDKVAKGMKIAVATFGEEGSLAWNGKCFYSADAVKAEKVVNTAGAGDSFISGFLYGILHGFSIEECLKKGAAIAASVVAVFEPWVKENKRCL